MAQGPQPVSTHVFPIPPHPQPGAPCRERPQGASGQDMGGRAVSRNSAGEQLAMFIVRQGEGWEPEVANSSGLGVWLGAG